MSSLRDRAGYLRRMTSGLAELLGTPPVADAAGLLRKHLENREENFLNLVRRTVLADEASPYRQMFRLAGCGYEDLAEAVSRDGLETTLAALHRQGVWLAHDEFKQKVPIVRSNAGIPATWSSFENPLAKGGMEGRSGGSRSVGTITRWNVEHRLHIEAHRAMAMQEFGLKDRLLVVLKPVLPATDGLLEMVYYARAGCPATRWFSTVARSLDATHYRVATRFLVGMARLRGAQVPFPVSLRGNDFSAVAEWIARKRKEGGKCAVSSYASPAVRVASAAAEKGLDIRGTLFLVGGETLTEAKRRVIESTGAEVYPRYAITEIGAVGHACRRMKSGDSVHLFTDSVAVIGYQKTAPLSETQVNSLLFTTLLPYAPHVLINVEMDDAGELEEGVCECAYGAAGYTRVIRNIHSYGKLTGHGVTLVGTDMVRILEEVLPRRFGGCATDYQMVEWDGGEQTRLTLRVSRRVALGSPGEVRDTLLLELRKLYGGEIASRMFRDAAVLDVVHEDPIATARGKVLPLHLLGGGSGDGARHES